MAALALLVASIGIADSVNPSTVVPALWLARRSGARGVASFTAGVFAGYLAGGLVLVLGPGPALIRALRGVGPELEHWVEAGAGAALLVATAVFWVRRRGAAPRAAPGFERSSRAPLALGAGISLVELPTAFMYFGAVSAILDSGAAVSARVLLVFAYNVLFVLPLLAILAVRAVLPDGGTARLLTADRWLRRGGPIVVTAVVAVAGAALMGVGVDGMLSA